MVNTTTLGILVFLVVLTLSQGDWPITIGIVIVGLIIYIIDKNEVYL